MYLKNVLTLVKHIFQTTYSHPNNHFWFKKKTDELFSN